MGCKSCAKKRALLRQQVASGNLKGAVQTTVSGVAHIAKSTAAVVGVQVKKDS